MGFAMDVAGFVNNWVRFKFAKEIYSPIHLFFFETSMPFR
jgi:hypothetical protein